MTVATINASTVTPTDIATAGRSSRMRSFMREMLFETSAAAVAGRDQPRREHAGTVADTITGLLVQRRGHFRMESGYHSAAWFELGSLFDHPDGLSPFVTELARRLASHGVDSVCGPMTGGANARR